MSKEGQLAKNTAIISIGKCATQLITFFLLPLYTKLLTTEEYGIVDLLNSLVVFLNDNPVVRYAYLFYVFVFKNI